ncbi:MAG: hypothetical protein KGI56_03595 [Acidobacteriota bacterium]|nr:hypothetical protein [Acidobacteriota bacterium]
MTELRRLPFKFRIQADYGGCYIWTDSGGASLDIFNISDNIRQMANNWASNYFEDEASPAGQSRRDYNQEGLKISQSIKQELGSDYNIEYRYFENSYSGVIWKTIIVQP